MINRLVLEGLMGLEENCLEHYTAATTFDCGDDGFRMKSRHSVYKSNQTKSNICFHVVAASPGILSPTLKAQICGVWHLRPIYAVQEKRNLFSLPELQQNLTPSFPCISLFLQNMSWPLKLSWLEILQPELCLCNSSRVTMVLLIVSLINAFQIRWKVMFFRSAVMPYRFHVVMMDWRLVLLNFVQRAKSIGGWIHIIHCKHSCFYVKKCLYLYIIYTLCNPLTQHLKKMHWHFWW